MGLGLGPLLSFSFFLGGLPLLCPSAEEVPVVQNLDVNSTTEVPVGQNLDVNSTTEVPVVQNLDVKKLAGKWYPIVSAKSEAMPRPFYAFTLETEQDGGALLKLEIPRYGSCRVKKYPLQTVSPGVFNMEDNSSIRVLDTDYDSFLISEFLSGTTIFLCLYATEKEVQEKVLKKFVSLAEKMNLSPERLFFRHQVDLCSLKKRKEESK